MCKTRKLYERASSVVRAIARYEAMIDELSNDIDCHVNVEQNRLILTSCYSLIEENRKAWLSISKQGGNIAWKAKKSYWAKQWGYGFNCLGVARVDNAVKQDSGHLTTVQSVRQFNKQIPF